MNKHLNIFSSYSKEDKGYKLENDLTRALAICLQEDKLLLHEVLKKILDQTSFYNTLFDEYSKDNKVNIEIQKEVSSLENFEHIFAVSLTSSKMNVDNFFNSQHHANYDPICDLVITINNIVIIVEVKRDATDCSHQLYNQIFNAFKRSGITNLTKEQPVTPVDLNWYKLMEIVVNVNNFHKNSSTSNRFLKDFIQYIRQHNYNWLPEASISSLNSDNKNAIYRRIRTAVENATIDKLDSDRIGFRFKKPYADELIFRVHDNGDLVVALYPANTKAQGYHVFNKGDRPIFKQSVIIEGVKYDINKTYHIKFSSFQKYFAGLWFTDSNMNKDLYTNTNFHKYTGRKKKGKDWEELENLFDSSFKQEYDWKKYTNWDSKVIGSGKTQFDVSFGYELVTIIPFQVLKQTDTKKEDISSLSNLLKSIYEEFLNVI